MRFTDRPKWKTVAITVICLIGLLAAIGGSFAAYTNSQAFQRGVARNRDNETVRFTSNYLQSCASGTDQNSYAGRTVLFGESEKTSTNLSVDLYIYNYANGNTNLISQKDISYNLTITFSGGDEKSYSVKDADTLAQVTSRSDTTVTYEIKNKILIGRAANFHKYTITFPGSDLDRLKITASAVPTNLSVTNNQILAAVIAPCTGSTTQIFSAKGEFVDTVGKPSDYYGFNYEISISSGRSEDATLSWNPEIVEIDKFFLINLKKTEAEITNILNTGKLTLTMDQSEGTGDYLIPFYIKDKSKILDTWNWDNMKEVITFTATQVTQ